MHGTPVQLASPPVGTLMLPRLSEFVAKTTVLKPRLAMASVTMRRRLPSLVELEVWSGILKSVLTLYGCYERRRRWQRFSRGAAGWWVPRPS